MFARVVVPDEILTDQGHEYLPYLLFAYREVPQESTGFSPFELLYGRKVRGPLDVLRETWTGETEEGVPVAACMVQM